jgi:hypothetical protein
MSLAPVGNILEWRFSASGCTSWLTNILDT